MVGGVSPKKAGTTHLGLPVFGSVKEVGERSLTAVLPLSAGTDESVLAVCVVFLWFRLLKRRSLTRL